MARSAALALIMAVVCAGQALAWSRSGHMVTAAIAYDDLAARDPALLARAVALLDHHPDRGPFQVAVGAASGEDKARRLLAECARWPDDARGTPFDHPTWHYADAPVAAAGAVAPMRTRSGEAFEAFALNVRVLADPQASEAERALALCWVLHLGGDIHQPLHAAQLFSRDFPGGDPGGSLEYVQDPVGGAPITLHWFWDVIVARSDAPADVAAQARVLEIKYPRPAGAASAKDFPAWADESYRLATDVAYREPPGAMTPAAAPAVPKAYLDPATAIAERRLATAGHRLADILQEALASGSSHVDGF